MDLPLFQYQRLKYWEEIFDHFTINICNAKIVFLQLSSFIANISKKKNKNLTGVGIAIKVFSNNATLSNMELQYNQYENISLLLV